MLEVEVKMALMAPGALRDRLRAAGATAQPVQSQVDVYFSHADRNMAARDEALRLRNVNGAMELTFKGPRKGTGAKVRVEENLAVAGDPTALLGHLGWRRAATVRKQREEWSLDDVRVCIDEVDGLGAFVEVEVLSDDAKQATERVEQVVAGLGLTGAERFDLSYLEMAQSAGLDLS